MLQTALDDPGAFKSGEYLYQHIIKYADQALQIDKEGLINALRQWIALKKEPETMLAARVAKTLILKELLSKILKLREEILSGEHFPCFYIEKIDKVIDKLS